MDLSKKVGDFIQIIYDTGNYISTSRLELTSSDSKRKADRSLVTHIDVGAEEMLKSNFLSILPNSGFLGEESGQTNPNQEYLWIVDPIDGTTNFIHGFPMYCISVALYHVDKCIFGTVYDVPNDEFFTANQWQDGAFLNGTEIKVTETDSLSESLLATGFPTVDFSRLDYYVDILKSLMHKSHGIRRLGSAALDLAYVSCGRCEGFYEYGLSPWDVAGGAYLVQKAGGKVSDFKNENNFIYGREIIATNGFIHQELQNYF